MAENNMKTKTKLTKTNNTFSMTLRLSPEIASEVENTAYELRMSKAAWIRRSIRRGLEHSGTRELPLLNNQAIREALTR
jgi:hypothetical protein